MGKVRTPALLAFSIQTDRKSKDIGDHESKHMWKKRQGIEAVECFEQ
jgi:hypothetical protein